MIKFYSRGSWSAPRFQAFKWGNRSQGTMSKNLIPCNLHFWALELKITRNKLFGHCSPRSISSFECLESGKWPKVCKIKLFKCEFCLIAIARHGLKTLDQCVWLCVCRFLDKLFKYSLTKTWPHYTQLNAFKLNGPYREKVNRTIFFKH